VTASARFWRPVRIGRDAVIGELHAGPHTTQSLGEGHLDTAEIDGLPYRLDNLFRRGTRWEGYGDRLRIRTVRRQNGRAWVVPSLEEWDAVASRLRSDQLVPVRAKALARDRAGPVWILSMLEAPLVAFLRPGRHRHSQRAFDALSRGALLKLRVDSVQLARGRRIELKFRAGHRIREVAARRIDQDLCLTNAGQLLLAQCNDQLPEASTLLRDLDSRVHLRADDWDAHPVPPPQRRGVVFRTKVPGANHGERPVVLLRRGGLSNFWVTAPLSSSSRRTVCFDPVTEPFTFRPSFGHRGWRETLQIDVSAYLGEVSDPSLLSRLEGGG
jgi:hypothetical protein